MSDLKKNCRMLLGRVISIMILSILGFLLLCVGLLFGFQRKLIYFPRPYIIDYRLAMTEGMVVLTSETNTGAMQSFYVPPAEDPEAIPEALWILFGGNASLALDWLTMIENIHQPRTGYLLIEYPGYGNNPGKPTAQTIPETTDAAFAALVEHLRLDPKTLPFSVNILAHSLGDAIGLDFATRHETQRIVLVSPFTSLIEMARRTVGWPLCQLLLDRFDNRASLSILAGRDLRPSVTIIHGDADDLVPVAMGRELTELYPDWIHYIEIPGGDHNFILTAAEQQITEAMFPAIPPKINLKASIE